MSGGGAIQVGLHLSGVEDARRAAEELHRIHAAATQLQSLSASPFVNVQGPLTGLAQGRAESEDHLRTVTDMWKAQVGLNTEFETYYRNVLNVGNAYGYQRDQMIAVRREFEQIQSLAGQAYAQQGALGFARGYGMDPAQTAGALGSFTGMGALNAGNQQPFLEMLSSAVARGSQGGFNIMMDRFLPILQSLSQQQLMSTPTGVSVGGIAQTLTRYNASGVPGFRDEGGMRLYQGIDQSIKGASGGMAGALLYNELQQQDPSLSYAGYIQRIGKGASDPELQRSLLTAVHRMRPGNSEEDKNWRALYINAAMPSIDPVNARAMDDVYFDAQGNYIPDQDLSGLAGRYGGTATNETALPLLARLDTAKSAQDLQGVMGTYRDLAGKPLDYTLTGDFARDKQAIGGLIAGQTTPLMQTDADRMSKAQADQAKAFEDGARELYRFNQALRELNVWIAEQTKGFASSGVGGAALFGGTMIGGAVSGAIGGLTSLATLGLGTRALGYMLPAGLSPWAALASSTSTAGIGSTIDAGLVTAGGTTAAAGGTSLMGPAALVAALALGGGAAASWGNRSAESQGATPFGSGSLGGVLSDFLTQGPLGMAKMGVGISRAEMGLVRKTGLLDGPDNWAAEHLPGYAGIFGKPGEEKSQQKLDDIDKKMAELVRQGQEANAKQVYQDLVRQGVPPSAAYEQAMLQAWGPAWRDPNYINVGDPASAPGNFKPGVVPSSGGASSGGGGGGGSIPGSTTAPSLPMTGTKSLPYGPTSTNRGASDPKTSRYRDIIERFALPEQIDPDIVQGIINQESGGDAGAIGLGDGKGNKAMGLMQVLMSEWPKGTPESVMLDPVENIKMGIAVLKGKRNMVFGARPDRSDQQNWDATIAAYYGGISRDGTMTITTGREANGMPSGQEYVDEVKGHVGTIKGGGSATSTGAAVPQAVLLAGSGATAGGGATGEVYDFMGMVELAVTVNGQASSERPVLQFGRTGTSTFAKIINTPRGVS